MRIARYLAMAGVASRRACEELLASHCVEVNGERVTSPALKVDPHRDQVYFDGRPLRPSERYYLLLYKPVGVTCSSHDRHAARLVRELLPQHFGRLFTVGRLDRDSEGLLVCTNDGQFAQRVAHPRHGVEKTYRVYVRDRVDNAVLRRMRGGLVSEGEVLRPRKLRRIAVHGGKTMITELEIVLQEGRKREIRRLCQAVGADIVRLQRIGIGPIFDAELKPGQWRHLRKSEVAALSS